MTKIEEIRQLVESLMEENLSDADIIERSSKFFRRNVSELDAEFATGILQAKSEHGGDAVLPIIEEYAARGAPAAQLALGVLMLEGRGIAQNRNEALFWLIRAFNGKNPNAGFILAIIYLGDNGVAEDTRKARRYMKVSADQGVPRAQFYYGQMLGQGVGGPVDDEQALMYIQKAADAGHSAAIESLEDCHWED